MSDTTIADRLRIRPGSAVWFSPISYLRLLGPLPPGAHMTGTFAGAGSAVLFVSNASSVEWFLRRYGTLMASPGAVWICAPTRARTDFNHAYLASILAGHGLSPLEEVPLDSAWIATRVGRFVPRGPSAPVPRPPA